MPSYAAEKKRMSNSVDFRSALRPICAEAAGRSIHWVWFVSHLFLTS